VEFWWRLHSMSMVIRGAATTGGASPAPYKSRVSGGAPRGRGNSKKKSTGLSYRAHWASLGGENFSWRILRMRGDRWKGFRSSTMQNS